MEKNDLIAINFETRNSTIRQMRTNKPVADDWKAKVEDYFFRRRWQRYHRDE